MINVEKILIWISLIGKFGHFFNAISYLRTIIISDFIYYIIWETSFRNLCTQLWYHFACSSIDSENGIMSPANLGFVNCFPFILISCPSRSLNFGNFALESFQKRLSIRGCLGWHYLYCSLKLGFYRGLQVIIHFFRWFNKNLRSACLLGFSMLIIWIHTL